MLHTKHRILHISIFAAIIMLVSACNGTRGIMNKVKHSSASNIHRIAIVKVSPGELGPSKPHKNKRFFKIVDTVSTGLTKVKNWKTKHPKTFWKGEEYKYFSSRLNSIWGMYSRTMFSRKAPTGYGVKMPSVPFGANIVFVGSKIAATKIEYKKLCDSLNVDALAFIDVDYYAEEVVMSPQEIKSGKKSYVSPGIVMRIRIIDKFGDLAVINRSDKITSAKKIYLIDNIVADDTVGKSVTETRDSNGKVVERKVNNIKIKGFKKFMNTNFSTSQGPNFDKEIEVEYTSLLKKVMSNLASKINKTL